MKGEVEQIARVRRDLLGIAVILGRRSPGLTIRFLDATEKTFRRIADMPGFGEPYEFEQFEVTGLRRCLVAGFRNYLVYYFPTDRGVKILRVIHGARNTEDLFEPDDIQ